MTGVVRCLLALGLTLAAAGCVTRSDVPPVEIVRDLSSVAGCRFVGTIHPPRVQAGLRSAAGYDSYLDALRRETYARGGSHLYLLNEAAGWGAASAVGTAYACVVTSG